MKKIYRALVCCRAGMGSSTLLKIKADQVIRENNYPIETEYGTLDSLMYYKGDLVITMADLAEEIKNNVNYACGVTNIVDKEEMKRQLETFLRAQGEDPESFRK